MTLARGSLGVVILLFVATFSGCLSCPPCPEPASLPGKDFATPRNAFEYLREAIILGETSDAYAHHEFRCFSDRMKREKRISKEDYFLVRGDALAFIREKIGDPRRVQVAAVDLVAPDRAELRLSGGGKEARVTVVRENGYDVRLRDRSAEAWGDVARPEDAVSTAGGKINLSVPAGDAGSASPDNIYEIKYSSEWKFYSIDETDLAEDFRRRIDEKQKTAPPPPTPKI
jgi:hypothetical protein